MAIFSLKTFEHFSAVVDMLISIEFFFLEYMSQKMKYLQNIICMSVVPDLKKRVIDLEATVLYVLIICNLRRTKRALVFDWVTFSYSYGEKN